MNKTVEEINKMIMEDAPMEEINDAIGYIDIYSCFDPIFEPPIDFLEECRRHWEAAQSSFRETIERKIGNTVMTHAISSKMISRPISGEMPPTNIPAYNIGMTITRG